MRTVYLFLFITLFFHPAKAFDTQLSGDSVVFQYGNDTLLQTLSLKWSGDTAFDFTWLSQDMSGKGMVEIKGKASRADITADPVIKNCPEGDFPADHFVFEKADCRFDFFIQYLHREKAWIDRECSRMDVFKHVPLNSQGIMNRVD